MFFKKKNTKGLHVILIGSMIGMGTFSYIPSAFAESDQQTVTPADQENQQSNTLLKLEIEGIPLNQAFSADLDTYSATVESETQSIKLNVAANNPESSITVNGQAVANESTGPLFLQTSKNTFVIKVNDGSHEAKTYTLTVTRKQSNNNLLKKINLSIGELSPKFDSTISDYSVSVENKVDAVMVMPEAIENKASIKVNDTLMKDEGVSLQIPVGKSDIILLVTAENGDKKTYTIHIVRAAKQDTKPSSINLNLIPNANGSVNRNNSMSQSSRAQTAQSSMAQSSMQQNNVSIQKTSTATLSSLTVSEGTWDNTFTSDGFTYHLAVPSEVASVTINPSSKYSSAVISIEGSSNKTIQLAGKKTVISVLVTRGDDRKTYVLVFDKEVQQAETTTAAAAAAAATLQSTNSNSSSTSLTSSESTTPATVDASVLKQGKGNTSTTIWGKIEVLFKRIFN